MDYFNEAFGGFHPESDKDAAVKFALCVLVLDNRIDELLRLVEGDGNLGGIEGEPGWIVERRDDDESVGYNGWPDDARFRIYVDPESYSLTYPEFYADRQSFYRYVKAIVNAYKYRYPEQAGLVGRIEEVMDAAE